MKIRVNNISRQKDFIVAIKLTRFLTGWGLKESKDFVEAQPNVNGIISLTIDVDTAVKFPTIKSYGELVALIVADRWLSPLNDAKNIENLDAPVKKTRPTIASLTKELEEERKVKNSYNASLASLRLELKALYERIDENQRNYTSISQSGIEREIDLNSQLSEKQEKIDDLQNEIFYYEKEIVALKNKATEIIVNGTKIIITNDSITYLK